MTDLKVGDRVRVRKGSERVLYVTPDSSKLYPGEYTILSVNGDFVSIDPNRGEFFASRFELVKSKLDGIGEGDKVRVTTNNGLSGTFTVQSVNKGSIASKEWEADISVDNIVSIEVVTKAKPPLPDEPPLDAIVVVGGFRPWVRTSKGWDIAGDVGMKGKTWGQLLGYSRWDKRFTLLFDGRNPNTAPKVVTW